jgi:hypothetical protein
MRFYVLIITVLMSFTTFAIDYHVSVKGNNSNSGSASAPFKTISFASEKAQAGDVIIVHKGVYRERVTPLRGGESDSKRIIYRAADGEKVEIKGSEIIKGWKKFAKDVWKVTISNSFFGDYNPYKDIIAGDWFTDYGWDHHTGEVYLNGQSLFETAILQNVLTPKALNIIDSVGSTYTWYCETDKQNTYIYANFHGKNPNKERIEINVRESCFYPAKTGVNYITISGFKMSQAATQWAPPTAEQIGLIGTFWSKGWIIENNIISDSKCTGITLGKDRKSGQNVWSKNRCKGGDVHYNEVIFKALEFGWSKENIGSHIVRNNTIHNCEQAGIVGSLGAIFSQIYNNHIYDIWIKRQFSGAELAGIKLHGAVDVVIKNNRINNVGRGIWLDWMAQGTRVTQNLLYDNSIEDIYVEVNHGPFMVDNNIFLSEKSVQTWSEGSAFVHNLINGFVEVFEETARYTPYLRPHSTKVAGLKNFTGGQSRWYNNIFVQGYPDLKKTSDVRKSHFRWYGYGLAHFEKTNFEMLLEGNVYLQGALPYKTEPGYLLDKDFDAAIKIVEENGHGFLLIKTDPAILKLKTQLISTQFLGKTKVTGLPFVDADDNCLIIATDFLGIPRNKSNPMPGPFENMEKEKLRIQVW